ncbi:MAG: transcription termination/antitermination protein NusG [Bryobacteraceae bacterium]
MLNSDPPWFALTVRPNHERAAVRGLSNQGFDSYLPLHRVRRRWSDRVMESDSALFPGYVFCRFQSRDKLRVLKSAGVRSIIGLGGNPAPVDEEEISAVRTLVSSGRPISPWPYLHAGQKVSIQNGPLASLRGVVVRTNGAWRAVVSVEALSCSVAVEVDYDAIRPEVFPEVFNGCQ